MGGIWIGACAYADDLALLAPDRLTLQRMVAICEDYGKEHNLVFSTDPDPAKSKTKCVYFSGQGNKTDYPPPIVLDGEELPWVSKVDHLGHVLQQSLSMEADANKVRGSFMSRSSDIRESLYFAHPEQRIQGIQLYCCDGFGSMLWDLGSKYAESYFKAWNIQARLAWRVPRETHTNLVEGFLCKGYPSLRNQILSRYVNFAKTLSASPSKEIRFVFNLIKDDKGSVTARNMTHINRLCNCQTLCLSGWKVKDLLPSKNDCEAWRTSLLSTLLDAKINKSYGELNLQKQTMEDMIRSLCVS